MNKKTKIIIIALAIFITTVYTVNAASVSILSWYLNGDDGQLQYYVYNSKYSSEMAFASSVWNGSKKGIATRVYDSSLADVIISDVEVPDTNVLATTYASGSIKFNLNNMEKSSSTRKKHVAIHEVGHALGLAHNSGAKDVMRSPANDMTVLSSNDKASLEASYSRYRK